MESPMICRACLTEIHLQYIDLDSPLNDITVLDTFNYCTTLQASLNDAFPTSICLPCGTSLQTAYEFIKTAHEADQILRNNSIIEKEGGRGRGCRQDDNEIISHWKEVPGDNDIGKQYLEEYVEDVDNIEIKQEQQDIQFEVLSTEEKIDIEFIDEDKKQNFRDYIVLMPDKISEQKTESQELDLFNEAESKHSNTQAEEFIKVLDDILYDSDNQSHENESRCSKPKKTIIKARLVNKDCRPYQCDTCEETFITMLNRNRHEFLEHKEDDSQVRKCKLCDFSTSSLSSWQTHRYRHEKPTEKKYLCSYCPKKFINPKSLHMHEDYHHGNKECAAKCEKCDKKFMNKQKLEYHILSAHSNGRNYKCPECPKSFKNNFQLKAHKKLHTERTIDCPQCDKKFLRHVDLRVHMRTHTGELPYQCHLCDKRYRIKVRLTYHLQRHFGTKHKCEMCSSEFNSKSKLRLHMFEHIGMPFVCDQCQMGFKNRLGLSRHSKAVHSIILTDEDLLQNRLNNENNVKRGVVSDSALIDHSNTEHELEV